MRLYVLVLCFVLVGGCVSVNNEPGEGALGGLSGPKILANTNRVTTGMTLEEAMAVIGKDVVVGYQKNKTGVLEPIVIKNPYREETIRSGGETYRVIYFFYSIVKADGIISDEELMPLIFKNNKLVAKGRDHLFKLKGP